MGGSVAGIGRVMPYRVRVFQRLGRGRDSRFVTFPDGGVLVVFRWWFGGGLVVAIFRPCSSPRRSLRRLARRRARLVFFVFDQIRDRLVVPVIRRGVEGGRLLADQADVVHLAGSQADVEWVMFDQRWFFQWEPRRRATRANYRNPRPAVHILSSAVASAF